MVFDDWRAKIVLAFFYVVAINQILPLLFVSGTNV
jgi:hypothetical protein